VEDLAGEILHSTDRTVRAITSGSVRPRTLPVVHLEVGPAGSKHQRPEVEFEHLVAVSFLSG